MFRLNSEVAAEVGAGKGADEILDAIVTVIAITTEIEIETEMGEGGGEKTRSAGGRLQNECIACNGGEKKKIQNVCTHFISKRIEVESPGWSGLVRFLIFYKT